MARPLGAQWFFKEPLRGVCGERCSERDSEAGNEEPGSDGAGLGAVAAQRLGARQRRWDFLRRYSRRAATGHLLDAARRRLARGVVERAPQVHVVVHALAEVLVEGQGLVEHDIHDSDAVDRPATDVLVKGRGAVEHPAYILDIVDRPTTDVSVKGRGAAEHPVHRRHARGVPRADVFVKGRRGRVTVCIILIRAKQIRHVSHPARLPRRNVAVRRPGGGAVREPEGHGRSNAVIVQRNASHGF